MLGLIPYYKKFDPEKAANEAERRVQMRAHIAACAYQLFIKNGIRAVGLADVQRSSGLKSSEFKSFKLVKYMLIRDGLDLLEKSLERAFDTEQGSAQKPLEGLENYYTNVLRFLSGVSPKFFYELQKYYRDLYAPKEKQMRDTALTNVRLFLEHAKAIKQLDGSIDIDLEIRLHELLIHNFLNELIIGSNAQPFDQVFKQVFHRRIAALKLDLTDERE